jgi:hypothetical protein
MYILLAANGGTGVSADSYGVQYVLWVTVLEVLGVTFFQYSSHSTHCAA